MFAELLATPGVTEHVEVRSAFGFMAIHGGSLERGTAEIATAAARSAGASLYTVTQPPDFRWHLPSRLVDPSASAGLSAFLDHVDTVVSVHGYGREGRWTHLLVGGADRALAGQIAMGLRDALPAYEIVDDISRIPKNLRGLHPANPVNATRAGGVQLELPPRIRGIGPRARPDDTDALVGALAGFAP